MSRPRDPGRRALAAMATSACASASTLPGGTSPTRSKPRTCSGMPPTELATTGTPADSASIGGRYRIADRRDPFRWDAIYISKATANARRDRDHVRGAPVSRAAGAPRAFVAPYGLRVFRDHQRDLVVRTRDRGRCGARVHVRVDKIEPASTDEFRQQTRVGDRDPTLDQC